MRSGDTACRRRGLRSGLSVDSPQHRYGHSRWEGVNRQSTEDLVVIVDVDESVRIYPAGEVFEINQIRAIGLRKAQESYRPIRGGVIAGSKWHDLDDNSRMI